MSFTDDFLKGLKKRNYNTEQLTVQTGGNDFTNEFFQGLKNRNKRPEDIMLTTADIAPVVTAKEEDTEDDGWFESGAFSDGYQFGDLTKTILGTAVDTGEELLEGIMEMGENVVDAGAYVVGGVGGLLGNDEFAEDTKEFIAKDLYNSDELIKNAEKGWGLILGFDDAINNTFVEDNSVLGEKSESLANSAGQLGATIALQAVGVPWWLTTGVTSFGGETESAFKNGASYGEAGLSAAITAGAEILTEKISGGISFGGKTLDDTLTKQLALGISNKTVKTLTKLGIDMAGEGAEEVLSGAISAVGQKITYADDKELSELFSSEDAFDAFIGGAVLGGGMSGINAVKAKKAGVDSVTGLNESEESVFKTEYNKRIAEAEKENGGKLKNKDTNKIYDEVMDDLSKGRISIDTIEEALGGETFKAYQDTVSREDALQSEYDSMKQEYDTLYKMKNGEKSDEQADRQAELKQKLEGMKPQIDALKTESNRNQLKQQLYDEVFEVAKSSPRLAESYNEVERSKQKLTADLSIYSEKQKAVVKEAVDSGLFNNKNSSREAVETYAKISEATDIKFKFTDTKTMVNEAIAEYDAGQQETIKSAISKGMLNKNNLSDAKTMEDFIEKTAKSQDEKALLFDFAEKATTAKLANGYYSNADGSITIKVDSDAGWRYTVGHEITHALEKTKSYDALRKAIYKYAETKGDYADKRSAIKRTYRNGEKGNTDFELTADLVGQYLFSDADFANNLAKTDRNVFQKVYDEIKHLAKLVTAGSKEARQLERAKKAFDSAYREIRKAEKNTNTKDGVQNSLISIDGKYYEPDLDTLISEHPTMTVTEVSDAKYKQGSKMSNEEYKAYRKQQESKAKEKYGIYTNKDTSYSEVYGEINAEFGKMAVGKGKSHGGVALFDVLPHIGNIFENAVVVKTKPDIDNDTNLRGVVDLVGAAALGDGKVAVVKLNVKEYVNNEAKIYDNRVIEIEELTVLEGIGQQSDRTSLTVSSKNILKHFNEFVNRKSENSENNVQYSLSMVEEVQPTSDKWQRTLTTEEAKARFPKLWDVTADDSEVRNPTQISSTVKSYRKVYDVLKAEDFDGTILDASSGLGYGTKAGIEEYGFNVEDIEPYPDKNYNPKYKDYSSLDKKYDVIISNAVLNVLPQDQRDALVVKMGELLNNGGRMFINVRGKDVDTLASNKNNTNISPMEWFVDSTGSYQKGFTKPELVAYLEDALGDGFTVKPTNMFGAVSAIVTKDGVNNIHSDNGRQYSLSDSDGKQLTKGQQEYFKDSKVRDENGNLLKMYHGTPNGDYTVFKEGTYFTSNKEYADIYQNTGASSISTGKVASNPKTFEVYLNITKPFDLGDAKARSVYINDYIKGGNALGINPYLSDAEYSKINTIDWTEGEDLRDFLIENGYDYDGIVLDEGAVGGYGEDIKSRGKSYVIFNSEQAKSVDNNNPSSTPDIQFSLSEPVEQTKDLIALHNVTTEKLIEALKLGGLPSPSIAITKKDIAHENYGEISMLLRKDAIDPELDSRNKVYGSDAWTPTSSNARTEYEVDYDTMRAFEKKMTELSEKTANGAFVSGSLVRRLGIEDTSDQSAARIAERLANSDEVRAAYLADMGQTIEPEYKTKIYNKAGNEALQTYIDKVGAQHLASVQSEIILGNNAAIRAEEETVRKIIRDNYAEKHAAFLNRKPEIKEMRIDNYMERNVSFFTVEDFIRDAWRFYEEGGTVTEEVDRLATSDKLRQAVNDSDLKAWLEPQIAEFLGEPGIYNGLDPFNADGTSRSFSQTHYEYTAENIVKAMQNASARGEGTYGANANSVIATATPTYSSIDEMHADSSRLKVEEKAAYDEILNGIEENLTSIEHDIMRTTKHHADNTFDEEQIIGSIITEAATGERTVAAVQRAFAREDYKISVEQAKRILALYNEAATVPTGYFEAKPERVVGFDEVAVVIIPYDADVKLKQELLNKGFNIAEYDPNVDGDRQRIINQYEEFAFSLSDASEAPTLYGNDIRTRDLYYESEPETDIAPVSETVSEDSKLEALYNPPDIAPVDETDEEMQERLASFIDEDAPIAPEEVDFYETPDTTKLDDKALKNIVKSVQEVHYLSRAETKEIKELIQKYSTDEFTSRDTLYDEVKKRFGERTWEERNEEIAEIKKVLRGYKIHVSPKIKAGITDYNQFRKSNFGKIRFSNDPAASPVDVAYMELSEMYPEFFPESISNRPEQDLFEHIVQVANSSIYDTNSYEVEDSVIQEMTDIIYSEVAKYKETELLKSVESGSREAFDSLEDYAPIAETYEDIAPMQGSTEVSQTAEPVLTAETETSNLNEPIKTVKERLNAKLSNLQTELDNNKRLREEAAADYDSDIARLQAQYNAKPKKTTKAANDILRRIERMRRMKGNVDTDYAKRISDLESKVAKTAEEVRTGESKTEQAAMRRELHQQITDRIKATFAERGFDFDKVLKKAKDLSTFATVDNTPQRVMEKALGYKEGQILSDLTVNKVAENETEGIKWLNSFTDRKNGLLAQISKQYGIKPGSKQSAAAQMYAEGFYVDHNNDIVQYGDIELAKDFPNAKVQENIKGLAADPRIRQIYDATLQMINESRARNAYPEIQKLDNYFLHFRAMDDTFSRLGIPFNPNDITAKDLPTDLNGVTADLKPGQPYFSSAMHRTGQRTSFDMLGGLERYLVSAKDQIYHIDDIQTIRALRDYVADTYGQAKGLEDLDLLTEEERQEKIKSVYNSHLSTFAKFLNEEANVIAGKTALIDRGLEGIIGRRGITFLDTINRQVGANMVGFNVSSSLTNFLAPVQAFAKTNKAAFLKGFAQTVQSRLNSISGKTDSFVENNPTIIRRQGADSFYRTPWQKAADIGYSLMGAVDSISTEIIVRGKYNELIQKGMSEQDAITEADKWTSRLMGDRSLGQQPQLYNSKMLGMITKFQLEVRNQLDSQFYDTVQEAKVSNEDIKNASLRNAKTATKVTSTLFQLAVAQHIFGKAFESVAGYNPAFDIIGVLIKALGFDDEEDSEDTVLDNIEQGFLELMGDLPYTSTFTGGRIPISSALPIEQFVTGKDSYGNDKSRWETIKETAPYYLMPGGYGQLKKTYQGLNMFDEEHPVSGSYTDSGNLRFPVEDTFGNRLQAGIFGQYASENARNYFDNERSPLKEKQIEEFIDVEMPIEDYWAYREGLSGLKTVDEKITYIASLDLPVWKKNILANNVTNRTDPIDLTDFDSYENFEEFDYGEKNPEKYQFLKELGISAAEYDDFDEDTKAAYSWAYNNPEKYTLSRAIARDLTVYKTYTSDISKLTADKDENGNSISGSKKEKVIDYINNLDAEYGEKIILLKSQYPSDDTYNYEIIDYLNGREDITYSEMVTILTELDFTVRADGTVEW